MKPTSKISSFVKNRSPENHVAFVLPLSRSSASKKLGIQSSSLSKKRSKLGRVPKPTQKRRSPLKRTMTGDLNELHLLSGKGKSSPTSGKLLSEFKGETSGSPRKHTSPCGKIPPIPPARGIQRQHKHSNKMELIGDEQIKDDSSRISRKPSSEMWRNTCKADSVMKKIEPYCFGSESCSGFKQYLTDLIDYQCWLAEKMGTLEQELEFALVRYNNSTSDEDPNLVVVGAVGEPNQPLNKKRFLRAALSHLTSGHSPTLKNNDESRAIRVIDDEISNTQSVYTSESCGDTYVKPNHKLEFFHYMLTSEDPEPQKLDEQPCTKLQPRERCMKQEDKQWLTKDQIAPTGVMSCKNVSDCLKKKPRRCCASTGVLLHNGQNNIEYRKKSLTDNVNQIFQDEEQISRACSTNTGISSNSEINTMENSNSQVACENEALQNVQPARYSHSYGLQYLLLFVITVLQCFLQFLSPFDGLK